MSKNVAECWKLLPFSNFPGEVCVLPQHIKVFSKPGDFDSMTVNNLLADIQKVSKVCYYYWEFLLFKWIIL